MGCLLPYPTLIEPPLSPWTNYPTEITLLEGTICEAIYAVKWLPVRCVSA